MLKTLESAKTELGNSIELIGEDGKNRPLIIGVFHGDEPQGKYLIEKYLEERYSCPPHLHVSPLLGIRDSGPPAGGGHKTCPFSTKFKK